MHPNNKIKNLSVFFALLFAAINSYAQVSVVKSFDSANPIQGIVKWNNQLYFIKVNAANHSELWKSEGTTATTTVVKDLGAGENFNKLVAFIDIQDNLLFTIQTKDSVFNLWKTDGTSGGTVMLTAMRSRLATFIKAGASYYFSFVDKNLFGELWKTDLTPTGTSKIVDLAVHDLAYFQNKLWILTRREVWLSDGTPASTIKVADKGTNLSFWYSRFYVTSSSLYIFTRHCCDPASGMEKIEWDGVKATSKFYPTPETSTSQVIKNLLIVGHYNGLHFWDTVSNSFQKIWRGGDYVSGPNSFFEHDNFFFFRGLMNELVKSDGTSQGTKFVCELIPSDFNYHSSFSQYSPINDYMYLVGYNVSQKYMAWKVNLVTQKTKLLTPLTRDPISIVAVKEKIFMINKDSFYFTEPSKDTVINVTDILQKADLSKASNIISFKDKLYLFANGPAPSPYSLAVIESDEVKSPVTHIPEPPAANPAFSISQNPINNGFNIKPSKKGIVQVYNSTGLNILTMTVQPQLTYINTASWLNGIYHLKYTSKDKEITTIKLVVAH